MAADPIGRARAILEREGVVGAARLAFDRLKKSAFVDEAHGWYELPLADPPEGAGLPEGLRLVRADESHAELAAEMQGPAAATIALLRAGHDLWLVCDRDRCAFSCWTFKGRTPVMAARGGWLALPPTFACLEDSATNAEYRGRGIAPAAWREIGRILRAEGTQTIVTKITTDNVPSQRAIMKAGFREIGTMRFKRLVSRRRLEITATEPTMAALAESLRR